VFEVQNRRVRFDLPLKEGTSESAQRHRREALKRSARRVALLIAP
jgi:hypothetical protein